MVKLGKCVCVDLGVCSVIVCRSMYVWALMVDGISLYECCVSVWPSGLCV